MSVMMNKIIAEPQPPVSSQYSTLVKDNSVMYVMWMYSLVLHIDEVYAILSPLS